MMMDRYGAILTGVLLVSGAALAAVPASRPATSRAATAASAPAPDNREASPLGRDCDGGAEGRRVGPGTSDLGGWVRTLAALAVVVVLIFVVRLLLRRLGPVGKGGKGPDAIEVLARSSLSAKHRLYLVRLGQRLVLVGSGPEGLTTLSEVTDPDEVSRLSARAGATARSAKTAAPGPASKAGQGREDES